MNTSVKKIVTLYLSSVNADGLCNYNLECGCAINDLGPCNDGIQDDCCPATSRFMGSDEWIGELEPGDVIYEEMTLESVDSISNATIKLTALINVVSTFLIHIQTPGDIEPPPLGLLYVWPIEFEELSTGLAIAKKK